MSWNITEMYVGCLGVELHMAKSGQGLGPHSNVAVKGKAIPLQAWTDPEGSRRLRLPDFKTIGT
jgi:hypothetical protein